MIRIDGWKVGLKSGGHRIPGACASCDGPRQESVVVQTSRRDGNLTTILRMKMPYCTRCAARVPGAGWRMMVLFCLLTILAIALPGVATFIASGADAVPIAAGGAGAALAVGAVAALLLLPRKPAAPATARGEAVSVTDYAESGDVVVFCTNEAWAKKLAAGNGTPVRAATRYRLVEPIAIVWCAALAGAMTFLTWYAAENPPSRTTPAAGNQKPAAKPPVPPAPAKKK